MSLNDLAIDVPHAAAGAAAAELRAALGARVHLPGDPGFDGARTPWNLAVAQHPFAVALPATAQDVVDAVRAATLAGLRIAPQSTGHAAGALAGTDLSHTLLLSLRELRGVEVDAQARTARVLGGSLWNDVLESAAPHGLTALHGSAGDVSVVGYSLSGGLSFYARAHGLAVNAVRAVEVVTADGSLVRASADEEPELFWALRGGSGAFGVVVAIEIDLLPVADVFAGMLLWDASRAVEVSHAWAEWTRSAPESATTALRILHLPPLPELPPFLSGRSVVVIDGAIQETDAAASALLEPLRALGPEVDTFGRMPAPALIGVHMDPPEPTPSATRHAMLGELPPAAVDAFVAAAQIPGVFGQELRHLGGAAARRPVGGGAVAAVAGDYLVHSLAMVPVPEAADAAAAAVRAGVAALDAWQIDALALTFIDGPGADRATAFGEASARLRQLKLAYDPANLFAAARPV
ncbi:FAD-dependent oxidoreductase [Microbacterium hibisci]|uniref:FAD-dependent oxidoreductase n=1 Tax=Microbacterium hibisci TaxID=2036000 RepID=UPI001940F047|nr:FAD-dependent oxidoreductase [Microbacterium hibisci]